MSLKLGALLELAEKTVVVGELGKLMVDEIPMERTEPGAPRALYQSELLVPFSLEGERAKTLEALQATRRRTN
jgi:hypothetical protein